MLPNARIRPPILRPARPPLWRRRAGTRAAWPLRLTRLAAACACLSLLALAPGLALAAGDGGDPIDTRDPRHIEARKRIQQEDYAGAERVLREWIAERKDSADAYNLLGYVTRKQGRLQEAVEHYREALRLKPNHRGAHEYLGETWLALGDLAQAKVHLAFLDDDCWLPCEEYSDLKAAVERYEQSKRR